MVSEATQSVADRAQAQVAFTVPISVEAIPPPVIPPLVEMSRVTNVIVASAIDEKNASEAVDHAQRLETEAKQIIEKAEEESRREQLEAELLRRTEAERELEIAKLEERVADKDERDRDIASAYSQFLARNKEQLEPDEIVRLGVEANKLKVSADFLRRTFSRRKFATKYQRM